MAAKLDLPSAAFAALGAAPGGGGNTPPHPGSRRLERCPQCAGAMPEGGWCSAGTASLEPAMIVAANIRVDSAMIIPDLN